MISPDDGPRFLVPGEKIDAYLRRRHHWGDSRRAACAYVGLGLGTGARIDEAVTAGQLVPPAPTPAPASGSTSARARGAPTASTQPQVPPPRRPRELTRAARAALEDFGLFRRRYLGRAASPWQEDAATRMREYLDSPRKEFVVVNTPPGVGKTTMFGHDLIVWMIVRNRRIRVLVGSRSEELAAKSTGRIRRTLERTTLAMPDEESLRRGLARVPEAVLCLDYGRFKPPPSREPGEEESRNRWTRKAFVVETWEGESGTEKEDTVAAWGFDAKKLGPRLDLIVWDDLEDTRGVRSLVTSTNLREDYDNEAETRLDPGGLLILQGQRLGPGDMHRHCLDKVVPVIAGEEHKIDPELWIPVADGTGDVDGGGGGAFSPIDGTLDPAAIDGGMPTSMEPTGAGRRAAAMREAGIIGWRRKYHHIIYPAHFESACRGLHGDGAPAALDRRRPGGCLLDPKRLPYYDLVAEAHNNPTKYRVLYQQEDVDPEGVLVRQGWVDGGKDPTTGEECPGCWDRERGRAEVPRGLAGDARSVMTIDPSPANWWSVQWWLFSPIEDRMWLLDLARRPMTASDFLDWDHEGQRWTGMLEDWWQRSVRVGHKISHVIVEANAAQKFLLAFAHVRRWKTERGVSIIPHVTGPWKMDPKKGPELLQPYWHYGRVRLPGSLPGHGREVSDPLVREVTKYMTDGSYLGTDDCLMAQWFLVYQAPQIFPARRADNVVRLRRPSWLAPADDAPDPRAAALFRR